MVKDLLSALLGTQAPPVAPHDMSADPDPGDPRTGRVVGWLVVAALAVLLAASAAGLVAGLS